MDATAEDKQRSAAPPGDDASSPTSAPEVRGNASSEPAAAGGSGDEEQLERFYALLANIRALRGMYRGGDEARKRERDAEPPSWRPAFRMEDFRDEAGCAGKKQRREQPEKEEEGEVGQEKDRTSASQLGIESKA